METKNNPVIIVLILLLGVGLGVGGFFLGRETREEKKAEEKSGSNKEELKDMKGNTSAVTFAAAKYCTGIERTTIYQGGYMDDEYKQPVPFLLILRPNKTYFITTMVLGHTGTYEIKNGQLLLTPKDEDEEAYEISSGCGEIAFRADNHEFYLDRLNYYDEDYLKMYGLTYDDLK